MAKPTLRFNPDKHFRILSVSDFHLGVNPKLQEDYNYKVIKGLDVLIEETKPDFVFLIGDQCLSFDTPAEVKSLLEAVLEPVIRRGLSWASVYGNHDRECGLPLYEETEIYKTIPGCLSEHGDPSLSGDGNYCLPVYSSAGEGVAFNIFALDSHRESSDFIERFGLPEGTRIILPEHFNEGEKGASPDFEQAMWYYNTSKQCEKEQGRKVPAVMFMHIPLPEYLEILRNPEECGAVGNKRETVGCCELNFGLFGACLQRGDVKGIFFGHEHLCDIEGKYCGVVMAQGAALGYNMSCHDDLRGGRVIDLFEDGTIETHAVKLIDIMGRDAMRRADYFEGGCKYYIRKL